MRKSYKFSRNKSKSTNKIPSTRNSRIDIVSKKSNKKLKTNTIKYIEKIQKNWRIFFKRKIENKIIKIQSIYRGYNLRKIFNDIVILNKKLECFFFIIRITMFRHGIKYDYLANKRIDYYSDHKKTKQFLLLQRRIKYFLFFKKIKKLEKLGIFNNIYIKTTEYRIKIKSKKTVDRYLSKPIIKYHIPLTYINMIQNNYRLHLKYIKKLPKHNIDKASLNKCPLITKHSKMKIINNEEIYKNVKMRPINNIKDFHMKIYYKYTPLLFIQRKYKERYNYLKENFKLKKHEKIKKTIINKHHYIYHATVIDVTDKILVIQKNIKYFLYRKHSMINLIPKRKIDKCIIRKSYGFREDIKTYFYEEFVTRLVIIIKKFFLSLYLNELLQKKKINKSTKNVINTASKLINELKKDSAKNQTTGLQLNNSVKLLKRKETFNLSQKKIKPVVNKQRHSSLLNNNDSNQIKDNKANKKKVSFKNDIKAVKKDKNFLTRSTPRYELDNNIKNSQSFKKNENHYIRKKDSKKKK